MIGEAIDRLVGVFSPQRQVGRVRARLALSAYRAADKTRRNKDWNTKARSADASVIPDQPILIQRCRDRVRNDPYIASINKAFVRNVVGKGFTHQAAAVNRAGQPLTEFNRLAGEQFWQWSTDATSCDAEQRHTFQSFQRWAVSEMVQAGGCLLIMSHTFDSHLMLQAVEYEQLDRTKLEENGNEIRGGVEVDRFGAAVAYHIYHRHPYDYAGLQRTSPMTLDSERIPADRVIHVYDPERARQSLGAPIIAPVLDKAYSLERYDAAQLDAARAEACIGLAITTTTPGAALGLLTPANQDSTDTDGNRYFNEQPLMVAELDPGEDIKGFTPTRPGNMYEPFVRAHLRAIAAGSGLSYEQIARDPHQGSYSSQRQNLLEDRREFFAKQQLLVDRMLQPVYREWLRLEILSGRINALGLGATSETIFYADWLPDGFEWIDFKNEVEAEALAIASGQTTKTEALAKHGKDFREVTRQRIAEQVFEREAMAAAGLSPATPQPQTTTQPNGASAADVRNPAPAPAPKPVEVAA